MQPIIAELSQWVVREMSLRLGVCGRCFYNPIEFLESLSRTSIRVDEFWVSIGEFPRVSITYFTSCGRVFVGPGQILVLPSRYCVPVDKSRAFTSPIPVLVHPGCVDEPSVDSSSCCRYACACGRAWFPYLCSWCHHFPADRTIVLTLEKLFVLPSHIKSCGYFRTFLVICCVNIPCDLLLEHFFWTAVLKFWNQKRLVNYNVLLTTVWTALGNFFALLYWCVYWWTGWRWRTGKNHNHYHTVR